MIVSLSPACVKWRFPHVLPGERRGGAEGRQGFIHLLRCLEPLEMLILLLILTKHCKEHISGFTLQMERARLRDVNCLGQDQGARKT